MASGYWKTVVVVVRGKKTTKKVWVPGTADPQAKARSAAAKRVLAARQRREAEKVAAARSAAARASEAQRAAAQRERDVAERTRQRAILIAQSRAKAYQQLADRRKELLRKAGLIKDKVKPVAPDPNATRPLRPGMSAPSQRVYEPGARTPQRTSVSPQQQRSVAADRERWVDRGYWYRKEAALKGAGEWDKGRAKEIERLINIEANRAGEGKIDAASVAAMADKYVKYARGVGVKRNRLVDQINGLLDRYKKTRNEAFLNRARDLYGSEDFKRIDAEYMRLFGGEKNAFNKFWASYGAVDEQNRQFWSRQMQATLDAQRAENNKRLKVARAKGDLATVRQLTDLNRVYAGKTGRTIDHYERRVINGKETKVPVYRQRTIEEELTHREAQRRIESERLRAEYAAKMRAQKAVMRGRGVVAGQGGQWLTPTQALTERKIGEWVSRGGTMREFKRPEDLQNNANDYLKDWEKQNPAPPREIGGGYRQASRINPEYTRWEGQRAIAEREFYDFFGSKTPGELERFMALPGISHVMAGLQFGTGVIGTSLVRIPLKAATGSSELNLGINKSELPLTVQKAVDEAKAIKGYGALGGAFSAGADAAAEAKVVEEFLRTPEGQRWFNDWAETNKARVQAEDEALAKALYGKGTDPATVLQQLFSAEGVDAVNLYGQSPTNNAGADLLFQLLADPTNAIPLKFTTYLARAKYAMSQSSKYGNVVSKGYGAVRDFVAVDESVLKAKSRVKEILGPALKGVNEEKVVNDVLAEVANIAPESVTRKQIRDIFVKLGIDRRLVNDVQLLSLIEDAIKNTAARRGIDMASQSDEIAKRVDALTAEAKKAALSRQLRRRRRERVIQEGVARRAEAGEASRRRLTQMRSAEVRGTVAKRAEAAVELDIDTAARHAEEIEKAKAGAQTSGIKPTEPAKPTAAPTAKKPRSPRKKAAADSSVAGVPKGSRLVSEAKSPLDGGGFQRERVFDKGDDLYAVLEVETPRGRRRLVLTADKTYKTGRAKTRRSMESDLSRELGLAGEALARGEEPRVRSGIRIVDDKASKLASGGEASGVGVKTDYPRRDDSGARGVKLASEDKSMPPSMSARAAAEVDYRRYPNLARALADADLSRKLDEGVAPEPVKRIEAPTFRRRRLPDTLRVQDPSKQASKIPDPLGKSPEASPVRFHHQYYTELNGEWVPNWYLSTGTLKAADGAVVPISEASMRVRELAAKAAKTGLPADRAAFKAEAQRLRNLFRMIVEDRPPRGSEIGGMDDVPSFTPTQFDLAERGGVAGNAAAEKRLLEDRAQIGYLRRVVGQARKAIIKSRAPGVTGPITIEDLERAGLELAQVQFIKSFIYQMGKKIDTVGLDIDEIPDVVQVGSDFLESLMLPRGSARLYEVFSGWAWKELDTAGITAKKLGRLGQVYTLVNTPDFIKNMDQTKFGLLLTVLEQSADIFGGVTAGAARFRDGGLPLFEVFHRLRLNGQVEQLQELSRAVDAYIAENAADSPIFARMWKVMEARAGLPWAGDLRTVERAFMDDAFVNDLHPILALQQIPNGYWAKPSQWRSSLSKALHRLPDADWFVPANPKWRDKGVLDRITALVHGVPMLNDEMPVASQIVDYIAGRSGTLAKGQMFVKRTSAELVRVTRDQLGARVFAEMITNNNKLIPGKWQFRANARGMHLTDYIEEMLVNSRSGLKGGGTAAFLDEFAQVVISAWGAGKLPLKNPEVHKLIWLLNLNERPSAVIGLTDAFVSNMEAIGKFDEAKAVVRSLFSERASNFSLKFADDAGLDGVMASEEFALWHRLEMITDIDRVRAWAKGMTRDVDRAEMRATGEASALDSTETRRAAEIGQYDRHEERLRDIANQADRPEAGAQFTGLNSGDTLAQASEDLADALSEFDEVFKNQDLRKARDAALPEAEKRFAKKVQRLQNSIEAAKGSDPEMAAKYESELKRLLKRGVTPDDVDAVITGRARSIRKKLNDNNPKSEHYGYGDSVRANATKGGALIQGIDGGPIGLKTANAADQVLAGANRAYKLADMVRAERAAVTKLMNSIDRLLFEVADSGGLRMSSLDFQHLEESIALLREHPFGQSFLARAAEQMGDTARWARLDNVMEPLAMREAYLTVRRELILPRVADLRRRVTAAAKSAGDPKSAAYRLRAMKREALEKELTDLGTELQGLEDELGTIRTARQPAKMPKWHSYAQMVEDAKKVEEAIAPPTKPKRVRKPKAAAPEPEVVPEPEFDISSVPAPEPDPVLRARVTSAEYLLKQLSGMSEEEYWEYLSKRAYAILKSKTASPAQKLQARRVIGELKAARYVKQLERRSGRMVTPTEMRRHVDSVVRQHGKKVEELIADKEIAPNAEDALGVVVEQGRSFWRRLRTAEKLEAPSRVKALGPGHKDVDHMPLELWEKVEAEVAENIRTKAHGGVAADYRTRLRGEKIEQTPEPSALAKIKDKTDLELKAKKEVLDRYGISVAAYDEARTVLWRGHVQAKTSRYLLDKAMAEAAQTGGDVGDIYRRLRHEQALLEAPKKLAELARTKYGHHADEILDDFIARYTDDGTLRHKPIQLTRFQRRTLEEQFKALTERAGKRIDDLGDDMAIKEFLSSRNAPNLSSREAAREFLVKIGAWAPRKAELINEGKASWSIDAEADYWKTNWGVVPEWADRGLLSSTFNRIFHDAEQYYERMRSWGVLSSSAEIRVRLSGATAQEIEEKLLRGDPALGLRARRELELQRRYVIERYGELVWDGEKMTAMPWLMTPDELRTYFTASTADTVAGDLIQNADELGEVTKLIQSAVDQYWDKYISPAAAAGPVPYEDVYRLASEVQARLLASPKWTRRLRDYFGDVIRASAAIQRAMIFSQLSFMVVNMIDVPIKTAWYRFTRRGVIDAAMRGSQEALRRADALTPQMLGLDLETTLYRLKQRPIAQKMKDPLNSGIRGAIEVAFAPIEAVYRLGPATASKAEMWGKMRLAKQMYAFYFDEALAQGAKSADLADAAARRAVKGEMSKMWPTVGDHPLARLFNEIVPFGIYMVKNKVLFLSEAIAHPWVLNKIDYIGRFIEQHNRREWEKQNPGVRMPDQVATRIELPWAPGYYLDLGQFSDATRGLSPLYREQNPMKVIDHIAQWVRVVNPGTQAAAYWIGNQMSLGGIQKWKPVLDDSGRVVGHELVTAGWTEPWSRDEPGLGSLLWLWDAWEDGQALGQGGWTNGELSVMLGKLAFFNAISTPDRGAVLYEYYKALREKDKAAAAAWLAGTPSGTYLSEWLKTKVDDPKLFLDRWGIGSQKAADENLWLHTKSPEFQKKIGLGYDAISRVKAKYAAELMALDPNSQAYRDKKAEMYLAISEVYRRFPELTVFEVYSKTPSEWSKQLAQWQTDKLVDDYFAFNDRRPRRADYDTTAEYDKAVDAWLHQKQVFLKQYPQVEQAIGSARAEYESVRAQMEADWDKTLDRIAERKTAIEKAEKADDQVLKDVLYFQNTLDYSKLDEERVALDFGKDDFNAMPKGMFGPPTLRARALKNASVLLDMEARRRIKAEREGRLDEYLREKFYADGMSEVILKAKGGDPFGEFKPGVFVREMQKRPRLLDMYAKKTDRPNLAKQYERNAAYVKAIGPWGKLVTAEKWDAAKRVWDNLPQWVKDQYYANHPGRARKAAESAEYMGYMKRWVAHFEAGDSKGGMKYFWSMPKWVRDRYFAKNPDKRVKYEADMKYGAQLADYFGADPAMRADILKRNPGFARWLARNGTDKETMRILILAGYQKIPSGEAWLRRIYRERYPEVFSQEAAGERRLQRVYDNLAAHPEMLPAFEKWVKAIWASYEMALRYGAKRPLSSYFELDYGGRPARDFRKSLSAEEASR